MDKWKVKNTIKVFENRILSVIIKKCSHPDKSIEWDFSVIETFNWINVIALTRDNKFILVKQHRLGNDEISIETPGGVIEEGENPEECAIRELKEETGFEGEEIHLLKRLWVNPAIMTNTISFYFIDKCHKISDQNLDIAEDIEVITADVFEVKEMLGNGEINHSIAVTALSLYFLSEYNKFGQIII
ncbi:MAG TPA: NUDIX hydrolase [Spirochaetota bacterium]|nr:NUDIX hydrolase [Spirochaetota bacterium]